MQQHTGQHILSTVFSKLYNGKTIGFHLGSEFVYIDIDLPELKDSDIKKIEDFANKVVFSNFEVKAYYIDKNDVSNLPLRKQPTVDSNIRIVEINDIDYTPCGGTHMRNTGEVGLIKIRKWEKYKGNIRVEFICGNRALEDFRWKNSQINEISNLLSVKDMDSLEGVKRIYDENKDLMKKVKDLKVKLVDYEIKDLISNSWDYNGINIVSTIFTDTSFKDVRYMATQIIENYNSIVSMGVVEDNKCQIVLGRSNDIELNIREIFNDVIGIINGQGGGNPKMAQGGGSRVEKLERCIETSLKLIESELYNNLKPNV
nr:DHHA1 domain-containing protein [Sporosalibacterium faouarense]